MVTRPLDLLSKVRRPPATWDWLYLVNAGLIALFFLLFYSKHVIAPGIVIQNTTGERSLRLPSVPQAVELGGPVALVISVMGRNLVFTEDGKYTFAEFEVWLRNRRPKDRDARLLVRADDSVSLNDFSAIFDAANGAGYTVQLAAEPSAMRR
mgnify:CR=1 FL=1